MIVAFALEILNLSIKNLNDGSIIDTADVIPANTKATKNETAITCPRIPQPEKITGSEINTRPGPDALGAPASKRKEKIIRPAISAIEVSTIATIREDFIKFASFGSEAE